MTAWVEFLKVRYRQGKVTDAEIYEIAVPKSIKNSKKLTADEKAAIKGTKQKGKKK